MKEPTTSTVPNGDLKDTPNVDDILSSSTPDALAKKHPPPESPEGIRTRRLVILSFWVTVILLGLPIWWWTTSIHRARLPLQQMLEWADSRVSSVVWLFDIHLPDCHTGL